MQDLPHFHSRAWVDEYLGSAQVRKHLDQEYAETREILADLGMAK